jgi:hypothetical protein
MKSIMTRLLLALSIAFCLSGTAHAQNTKKTHFMMVSIHAGAGALHPEIIVTKEDGTQQITRAGKNSWMTRNTFDPKASKMESTEDSLFQALKPYFDAGWTLASSDMVSVGTAENYILRYYFTRKDN